MSRTVLFWTAFILPRPLSAVVGDFLDKALNAGGLALSRYSCLTALSYRDTMAKYSSHISYETWLPFLILLIFLLSACGESEMPSPYHAIDASWQHAQADFQLT